MAFRGAKMAPTDHRAPQLVIVTAQVGD